MMTKLITKSVTCYKDVSRVLTGTVVPMSKVDGIWIRCLTVDDSISVWRPGVETPPCQRVSASFLVVLST